MPMSIRNMILTTIAAGAVLFALGPIGQEDGYWKSGPEWLGAIGWFGFLFCLVLLLATLVYAVVASVRSHHDRSLPR